MIYYDTGAWGSQIFRFGGTVWKHVWWKLVPVTIYTLAVFCWCKHTGHNLGAMRSNILGSTLSFLLVFRANTAYKRYWQGLSELTRLFCNLREIVALATVALKGGSRLRALRWRRRCPGSHTQVLPEDMPPRMDPYDKAISEARTDLIRWCLVFVIALKMHTLLLDEGLTRGVISRKSKWLVDWDRYRIRLLTTAAEFKTIDTYIRQLIIPQELWDTPSLDVDLGNIEHYWDRAPPDDGPSSFEINTAPSMRLPMAALYKINEVLTVHINDMRVQSRAYGMPERIAAVFIGLTHQIMQSYTLICQSVATPLPFAYFHLCKTLLFVYFLVFPFFIQIELGYWANVGELSILALALLGLDDIAAELENPFGVDDNDLDIYLKIANFEREVMFFLSLCGDDRCKRNFKWQEMFLEVSKHCNSPISSFLALRVQVESDGYSEDVIDGGMAMRTLSKFGPKQDTSFLSSGAEDHEAMSDDSF